MRRLWLAAEEAEARSGRSAWVTLCPGAGAGGSAEEDTETAPLSAAGADDTCAASAIVESNAKASAMPTQLPAVRKHNWPGQLFLNTVIY